MKLRCYVVGERLCKVIVTSKTVRYYPNWLACGSAGLCDYGSGGW